MTSESVLTVALLLFGGVVLALVMTDAAVRRLPLSPAVIYLAVGWVAGAALGVPTPAVIEAAAPAWVVLAELAVLMSLFAVGLRLRVPPQLRVWRTALLLAGPGVAVATVLGMVAAIWLLELPWPAALLLAAVMAPTDPVLASEVQIRTDADRDAVRISLTAEGALNDGSALPAVMLGLGLLGLHSLGEGGVLGSADWWLHDLAWPIGGGGLIGVLLGRAVGHALKARTLGGDPIARDELLYVGAVALACGVARVTGTSTFVVVFAFGATLLEPLRRAGAENPAVNDREQSLMDRLRSFGARSERLVEAATVLSVGMALANVAIDWRVVAFAIALVGVVRPLSVLAVVRRGTLGRHQRRLVAWFGIRGVGSLFYLAFVMEHGVAGSLAAEMIAAALVAIALSIVLHGVSATPLMNLYQKRRQAAAGGAAAAGEDKVAQGEAAAPLGDGEPRDEAAAAATGEREVEAEGPAPPPRAAPDAPR